MHATQPIEPSAPPGRTAWWINAVTALVSMVVTLALVEGGLQLLVQTPSLAPEGPIRMAARTLYLRQMNLVQFDPACAQHDPELGYTLRPGACTFDNAGFSTRLAVNSAGLRDDEASLAQPRIVVLGDSHAMGWGVEQDDTFAQHLERQTGLRVLNAGVSSYGTVRALRNLQRLDTSAMQTLVVQYCDNDIQENEAFVEGGFHLPVMDAATYDSLVAVHQAAARYRFGDHLLYLLKSRLRSSDSAVASAQPAAGQVADRSGSGAAHEARLFLEAFRHAGVDLAGVQILVFEVGTYGHNDDAFAAALDAELATPRFADLALDIETLDISAHVSRAAHYLMLDDHMNAAGHEVLADLLARRIER